MHTDWGLDEEPVESSTVWVICAKCGGARHLVFGRPEATPHWFCQDVVVWIQPGQHVEVAYLDKGNGAT